MQGIMCFIIQRMWLTKADGLKMVQAVQRVLLGIKRQRWLVL